MSNEELELTIRKAHKLQELRHAKERVKRLERELRGEPVQPEDPPYVPEFLRLQTQAGSAERADSDIPSLGSEKGTRTIAAPDAFGRNMPISRRSAPPQRSGLVANFHARSRHLVDVLPEPTP